MELTASIRSIVEVVTTDASVGPSPLNITRQYATLDWHNEIAAVLIVKEHRSMVH